MANGESSQNRDGLTVAEVQERLGCGPERAAEVLAIMADFGCTLSRAAEIAAVEAGADQQSVYDVGLAYAVLGSDSVLGQLLRTELGMTEPSEDDSDDPVFSLFVPKAGAGGHPERAGIKLTVNG